MTRLQWEKSSNHRNSNINVRAIVIIHPSDMHPEKWFEGYPVKYILFFLGRQKHLRFSRALHPFFSDLPYETQLFLRLLPQKISGAFSALKKIAYILQGAWNFLISVQIKRGMISMHLELKCFVMLIYKVNKRLIKYAKNVRIESYQITLAIHTQM